MLRKIRSICWERHVPLGYARKIRDAFEVKVWSVVTQPTDRVLRLDDFQQIFDEVTTVPVRVGELQGMPKAVSASQLAILFDSQRSDTLPLSVVLSPWRLTAVPPLLDRNVVRAGQQELVVATIERVGVAHLPGATGTGKTTQAANFAHPLREEVL